MTSIFYNPPALKNQYSIHTTESMKIMRYYEYCFIMHDFFNILKNNTLSFRIKIIRSFIHYQNRSILYYRPSNNYSLLLPGRQRISAILHKSIITFWKRYDEIMRTSLLGSFHHLLIRCIYSTIPDVLQHGSIEKHFLLRNKTNTFSQATTRNIPHILAINKHFSRNRSKQSSRNICKSCFSAPRLTNQTNFLPRKNDQ